MFSKIASITLPIFTLVLVGFMYSRRVKPDLGGANKLVVDGSMPFSVELDLTGTDALAGRPAAWPAAWGLKASA